MRWLAWAFSDPKRFERAQRLARVGSGIFAKEGRIARLPFGLGSWTDARDAPALPEETFRQWWRRTRTDPLPPPKHVEVLPPAPVPQPERVERRGPHLENWMAELRDADPGEETVVDLFRPANPQARRPGGVEPPADPPGPEPTP